MQLPSEGPFSGAFRGLAPAGLRNTTGAGEGQKGT